LTQGEREKLSVAYHRTHFVVQGARSPFVLRAGRRSRSLAALHAETGVRGSAFLTAWNPGSRQLPIGLNRKRQKMLETELRESGYRVLNGIGKDPTNTWTGEVSCLVIGILRREAVRIGRKYDQLAIVWIGRSSIPRLAWSD
jgi:hypothetical protein